jgi:23S rRNA pseudouridine1911/1915/1917 synthase
LIDVRNYQIHGPAIGQRLDVFLVKSLQSMTLSRTQVQRLIEEGKVRVSGKERPAHWALRGGEAVSVVIPEPRLLAMEAQDIPLDVLYEDAHLLVINKQAGLVTHPAPGNEDGTLVNALLFHCKEGLAAEGGLQRPGIVHRLDKDTTGCLVVAKSAKAFQSLQKQIHDRRAERRYQALVWGSFEEREGTIEGAIGRSSQDRKKMAVVPQGGREATTHFTVMEKLWPASLVELKLETGRTHQIRVHMASIKHPVLGDKDYGPKPFKQEQPVYKSLAELAQRQMLHAFKLSFLHPDGGRKVSFEAPLPQDFKDVLRLLRAQEPPQA